MRTLVVRPGFWLCLMLVGLGCYRFTLIDSGHFFWGDERRYVSAAALIDDLGDGDWRPAAGRLFEANGRPGFVLVSVVPTLAQRVIGPLLGILPGTHQSYDISAGFNVVVSLAVTCCIFGLGFRWTDSWWYALLIATVHAGLCHANAWIRHLMPYNVSILLCLLGLMLVSSPAKMKLKPLRTSAAAGLLTAAAYTCYPGYYAFVLINAVVLFVCSRRPVRTGAAFGGTCLVVVGLVELLARLVNASYLANLREVSGTIKQGFFGEGFVFAWRYLRDVEGPIGVALFVLFAGFIGLDLWRREARLPRAARVAFVAAVACYVFHASMGVLFHKFVFYGRILGMYLPFLVGGAVIALSHIKRSNLRWAGVCGLVLTSAWSFGMFAQEYAQLIYPADFLFETVSRKGHETPYPPYVLWTRVATDPGAVKELDSRFAMVADVRPDGTGSRFLHHESHVAARSSGAQFIGVNLKWLAYVRERDHRFGAPPGYRLLAQAESPIAFRATGYEAYKPWERERLAQRRYKMRIYERIAPAEVGEVDSRQAAGRY